MRIIGGKLKGSNLYSSKNLSTRPLKDLVRESIFNLLIHSNKISFKFEKINVLDLYAGTGSFGLECLSRGADGVFFVENAAEAIKILKKNIVKLNLNNRTKIFSGDVFKEIEKKEIYESKFNLIFCDPLLKILKQIIEHNYPCREYHAGEQYCELNRRLSSTLLLVISSLYIIMISLSHT